MRCSRKSDESEGIVDLMIEVNGIKDRVHSILSRSNWF